jgi:hypothetical protein
MFHIIDVEAFGCGLVIGMLCKVIQAIADKVLNALDFTQYSAAPVSWRHRRAEHSAAVPPESPVGHDVDLECPEFHEFVGYRLEEIGYGS